MLVDAAAEAYSANPAAERAADSHPNDCNLWEKASVLLGGASLVALGHDQSACVCVCGNAVYGWTIRSYKDAVIWQF